MTKKNASKLINSAIESDKDEHFVLYESVCRTERIVLFRNVARQLEYIMFSPCLLPFNPKNIASTNMLFVDEYKQLLWHGRKIQLYQFQNDNLEAFHYFFGMTTTAYLNQFSNP